MDCVVVTEFFEVPLGLPRHGENGGAGRGRLLSTGDGDMGHIFVATHLHLHCLCSTVGPLIFEGLLLFLGLPEWNYQ